MKLKIRRLRKPKGYVSTKLLFSKKETAEKYVENLDRYFLLKQTEMFKNPLSKRKGKLVNFAKPKRHCLTKQANKCLLWEEI